MVEIKKLRQQAERIIKKDDSLLIMRSCWDCNHSHEHLKDLRNMVIFCFICGRYYFKGQDITDYT